MQVQQAMHVLVQAGVTDSMPGSRQSASTAAAAAQPAERPEAFPALAGNGHLPNGGEAPRAGSARRVVREAAPPLERITVKCDCGRQVCSWGQLVIGPRRL